MNDKRPQVRHGLAAFLMGLVLLLGIAVLANSAAASAPTQASAPAGGTTYVVNSDTDNDDGGCDAETVGGLPEGKGADCTLREAIHAANANPGADTIEFALEGAGPHTITVLSSLPIVSDTVTIDGYSESLDEGANPASENTLAVGNNANILIRVSGGDTVTNGFVFQPGTRDTQPVGPSAPSGGIDTTPSGSIVQGLAIINFVGDGIQIGPNPDDDPLVGPTGIIIRGNFIGVAEAEDLEGKPCRGNGNNNDGVEINAPRNFVGSEFVGDGTDPGSRNLIACNGDDGVSIVSDDINRSGDIYRYAVESGSGNEVRGNYVVFNGGDGVRISSNDNVIGGLSTVAKVNGVTPSFERTGNVISGNGDDGVDLHDPQLSEVISDVNTGVPLVVQGNIIQANLIGTDPTGSLAVGNADDGIDVNGPDNLIGGTEPGAGNLISGHDNEGSDGVEIEDGGDTELVTGNLVQGNWIGTNISGTMALPNTRGVRIYNNAYDNLIGGDEEGAGNTISGNDLYGVLIEGPGTLSNTVQGNLIGVSTTSTTTIPLGNGTAGVVITFGASNTLIGGSVEGDFLGDEAGACTGPCNVISANGKGFMRAADTNAPSGSNDFEGAGVAIGIDSEDETAPSGGDGQGPVRRNWVQGNFIGTDPTGTISDPDLEECCDEFGNSGDGVLILESGSFTGDVTVGGPADSEGNLISGNFDDGIAIDGLGPCSKCAVPAEGPEGGSVLPEIRHIIQNNFIGTDVTGEENLGNYDNGIEIYQAFFNRIEGNLISGNGRVLTSQFSAPQAPEGGPSCDYFGYGFVCGSGIVIDGGEIGDFCCGALPPGFFSNLILDNYIGTNVDGTEVLGNALHGVKLVEIDFTIVGSPEEGGNLISGNGSVVTPPPTPSTTALPPGPNQPSGGPTPTTVAVGSGVVLDYQDSGCCAPSGGSWANGNKIQSNYIGTDESGTEALGNADNGVSIRPHDNCCPSIDNEVGGSTEEEGNLISGNGGDGVEITFNNDIRRDAAGQGSAPSAPEGGPSNDSCCTDVQNNYIGTDVTGEQPLGNGRHGVLVDGAYRVDIGGARGLGNVIAYNTLDGVAVVTSIFDGPTGAEAPEGGGSYYACCVEILTNSIHSNGDLGIDLENDGVTENDPGDKDVGSNNLQNFPVISSVVSANGVTTITGFLESNGAVEYTIEFFANEECDPSGNGEGAVFLDQYVVTTAGNGRAEFVAVFELALEEGQFLTATATNNWSEETSEFSACVVVEGIGPGPTATVTPCPIQFSDVPPGSTFYPYVRCLACRHILGGYPDGTYRPGANITRQQLAKIASNAAGFDEVIPTNRQTFADVPFSTNPSSFWVYIERLFSKGAIDGYECGTDFGGDGTIDEPCDSENRRYFRPAANVTRGQAAKIVSESAEFFEDVSPAQQTYQDVPPSGEGSTFWVFIERLSMRGIMGGYPCGTPPADACGSGGKPYFLPGNQLTRGQAAKIVSNTFFPNCQTPARP